MGNTHTHHDNFNNGKKHNKNNNKRSSTNNATDSNAINTVPTAALNLTNAILYKKPSDKRYDNPESPVEDYAQILLPEVLLEILFYCDKHTLLVAPKVCKQFYNLTLPDSYLWQQKCKIKNRRLISGRSIDQQKRTYKYIYLTQTSFNAYGNTQNTKNEHKAVLHHMLIKIKGKEFTGEGVYIKYNSDYHARWLGTIDEDYNVKIEEYYNRETEPYRYEGSLDLETGEIMGKYNKNTIQGIFKFTLSATLDAKYK